MSTMKTTRGVPMSCCVLIRSINGLGVFFDGPLPQNYTDSYARVPAARENQEGSFPSADSFACDPIDDELGTQAIRSETIDSEETVYEIVFQGDFEPDALASAEEGTLDLSDELKRYMEADEVVTDSAAGAPDRGMSDVLPKISEHGRYLPSLFARLRRSLFVQGVASAFDLTPSVHQPRSEGLTRDWNAVIGDFSRTVSATKVNKSHVAE